MPWFNIDDAMHRHPKVIMAGNASVGLWCRLGSYAAEFLTEGFVPRQLAHQYGTSAQIRRLVEVGLLDKCDGGYRLHDWLDWNRSKEQVLADRAAAAERKRRSRERHPSGHGVTDAGTHTAPRPRPRPTVLTTVDDDDRAVGPVVSSSSVRHEWVERTIAIAARAITAQRADAPNGYAVGVERNLRAERLDEITALVVEHDDPVHVAGLVSGSHVFARQAAREMGIRS